MVKLSDRQIAWFVGEAAKGREGARVWAEKWGVSPRHLQRLAKRYRDPGVVPVLKANRRPKSKPLTAADRELIEAEFRVCHKGASVIHKRLAKQGHELPKMKIHAHMRLAGLTQPNPRKQRKRSRVRYEREHSGSLLHSDYHRTSQDHPYVILWLDDASRRVLSGGEFPEETAQHAIETLQEALRVAALSNCVIRDVNTDRGSQFYANKQVGKNAGESQFQAFLATQAIHHAVSRANNPQTNGKLERLWHEYDKHRWRYANLAEWIACNNDQLHTTLWTELYETPDEAWQRKLPPESLLGLHLRQVEENLTQTRQVTPLAT